MNRLPRIAVNAMPRARTGATLTEVLMSLMIMSVGVLSVFSLYPIAVTRSIQATQAVHAKVLLGNAEAEMLSNPNMLNGVPPWRPNTFYFVGDVVSYPVAFDSNLTTSGRRFVCTNNGFSGATVPALLDISSGTRNYTNNATALGASPAGAVHRDLNADSTVNAGEIVWQRAVADATGLAAKAPIRSIESNVTVIDPLGWAIHNQQTGATLVRDSFGTAPRMDAGFRYLLPDSSAVSRPMLAYNGSPVGTVESTYQPLFSYSMSGGAFARKSAFDQAINQELTAGQLLHVARQTVSLDGSYAADEEPLAVVASGGTVTGPNANGRSVITLPAVPEAAGLLAELKSTVDSLEAADSPQTVRVTVSSPSAGLTESRWLVNGFDDDADGTVDVEAVIPGSYSVEVGPLPTALNSGTSADVTIRFEIFEPRYTWLATIARDASGRIEAAKCAVFFRRSFETAVEVGFNCQIGNDPGNTADDPETWASPPSAANLAAAAASRKRAWIFNGRDTVAPIDGGSIDTFPRVAAGWRLFDSVNGRWYRIESVIISPDAAGPGGIIEVELDRDAEVIVRDPDIVADPTNTLTANPPVGDPQVVIPTGVVRIFDLDLAR